MTIPLSNELQARIETAADYLAAGHGNTHGSGAIHAIKEIRVGAGIGLKDAKDIVDSARNMVKTTGLAGTKQDYEDALHRAFAMADDDHDLWPTTTVQAGVSYTPYEWEALGLMKKIVEQLKENNELIKDWIDSQT